MSKRDISGRQLRSQLDNRFAGSGIVLTKVEKDNLWDTSDDKFWDKATQNIRVVFPHDTKNTKDFDKMCKELSGEVTTYRLEDK